MILFFFHVGRTVGPDLMANPATQNGYSAHCQANNSNWPTKNKKWCVGRNGSAPGPAGMCSWSGSYSGSSIYASPRPHIGNRCPLASATHGRALQRRGARLLVGCWLRAPAIFSSAVAELKFIYLFFLFYKDPMI